MIDFRDDERRVPVMFCTACDERFTDVNHANAHYEETGGRHISTSNVLESFAARRTREQMPGAPLLRPIPPTPGASAAYLCTSAGCIDATCPRCAWWRDFGALCLCVRCRAPLEVHPWQLADPERPMCGACAGRPEGEKPSQR
jgi:hypothetical protein